MEETIAAQVPSETEHSIGHVDHEATSGIDVDPFRSHRAYQLNLI